MFFVPEIIDKKKRREKLTETEINYIIKGYVRDEIPDYQISALLMAIYFNGMDEEETTNLTIAMAKSGDMASLVDIEGVKIDKHSTGGIADTTTLVLIPLVASCGVKMPKMSGRGLGHTGGTIDKLESIPGFQVELSQDEFIKNTNNFGAAIISQSKNLVPADKKLYALRDVTATVDSMPLIASSIMSKKLAGGADKIVLDVKFGKGAFMKNYEDALKLGKLMVKIGELSGRPTVAFVTDMNQPLGTAIGNAIEIVEAADTLKGRGHKNLTNLCLELGVEILKLSNIETDYRKAKNLLLNQLKSGAALDKFKEIIKAQGGNAKCLDDYSILPQARYTANLKANETCFIKDIDPMKLGIAAMKIGAGRQKLDDNIDKAVGIWLYNKIGDRLEKNQVYAKILANDEKKLSKAVEEVRKSILFSRTQQSQRKIIWAKITKDGIFEKEAI